MRAARPKRPRPTRSSAPSCRILERLSSARRHSRNSARTGQCSPSASRICARAPMSARRRHTELADGRRAASRRAGRRAERSADAGANWKISAPGRSSARARAISSTRRLPAIDEIRTATWRSVSRNSKSRRSPRARRAREPGRAWRARTNAGDGGERELAELRRHHEASQAELQERSSVGPKNSRMRCRRRCASPPLFAAAWAIWRASAPNWKSVCRACGGRVSRARRSSCAARKMRSRRPSMPSQPRAPEIEALESGHRVAADHEMEARAAIEHTGAKVAALKQGLRGHAAFSCGGGSGSQRGRERVRCVPCWNRSTAIVPRSIREFLRQRDARARRVGARAAARCSARN